MTLSVHYTLPLGVRRDGCCVTARRDPGPVDECEQRGGVMKLQIVSPERSGVLIADIWLLRSAHF